MGLRRAVLAKQRIELEAQGLKNQPVGFNTYAVPRSRSQVESELAEAVALVNKLQRELAAHPSVSKRLTPKPAATPGPKKRIGRK